MLGVDLSDQLIAYYYAKIRCQRAWMPIMLQCMDVLRINLCIVYRKLNRELDLNFSQCDLYKKYIFGLINAMIRCLQSMKRGLEDNTVTRAVQKSVKPTKVVQTWAVQLAIKTQMSKNNALLSKWDYCCFIPGVHAICGVYLCMDHVDLFCRP